MKKYKLKKWYPSCLDLKEGDVITKWTGQTGYSFNRRNSKFFNPTEIENNPEFWEEVVEKDYEILSFKQNSKIEDLWESVDITCEKFARKSGQMFCTKPYTLEQILNNPLYSIHSIKRLSDGEVFTVGDKVRISKLQHDGSFIIDKFYFDCNNDKLLCNGKCAGNGHVSINKIKIEHVKLPLFTTEDGVDIFEDDYIYWIWDDFSGGIKRNKFNDDCGEYDVSSVLNKHEGIEGLGFSTKEAAEEYILWNKPVLSLKDVASIYPGINKNHFKTPSHQAERIKQLVKSRL